MKELPPASQAPAMAVAQRSTGNAGTVIVGASHCQQGCCMSGSEWQMSPPAAASLSVGSLVGSPDDEAGSQEATNVGAQSVQGAQHMAWEPVASHQHCEWAANSLFEAAVGIMMSSIDINLQQPRRCSPQRVPVQVNLISLMVRTRCPCSASSTAASTIRRSAPAAAHSAFFLQDLSGLAKTVSPPSPRSGWQNATRSTVILLQIHAPTGALDFDLISWHCHCQRPLANSLLAAGSVVFEMLPEGYASVSRQTS